MTLTLNIQQKYASFGGGGLTFILKKKYFANAKYTRSVEYLEPYVTTKKVVITQISIQPSWVLIYTPR